jgi:hypothetical protein
MLFSALPVFGLPRGLRQQVLRLVSDGSPEAASYRDMVVRRAGRFGSSGFPIQVSPAGRGRGRGLRSRAVIFAAAAAVIIASGGGGTTAYLLSHHRHLHRATSPTVTITITATPTTTAAPVAQTSPVAVTPPPTSPPAQPPPTAPPPSPTPSARPSPSPSPGTLSVSTTVLKLTQPAPGGPYTGTFTVTAVGGQVSYSIAVPASEQPYFSLSPLRGTLQSGASQVITVIVTGRPPYYRNPVTVEPGGIIVNLEYPPSG